MGHITSLPSEVFLLLTDHVHNIEDFTSLTSTCRDLRSLAPLVAPSTILRLAASQSRIFFRPSPEFLVAATARQLGDWARESPDNEQTLAVTFQAGLAGVLDLALALAHCGLTMQRIRELHAMRFSVLNPVTDIIDQCVGKQWYAVDDFWDGGRDDAYTISADPSSTLFHLAIYGEMFGPDLMAYLDGHSPSSSSSSSSSSSPHRSLSVETRLEFIKYCVPDFACELGGNINVTRPDGTVDPRRDVKPVGPYRKTASHGYEDLRHNNNVALTWVLKSTRWRPHWRDVRRRAGPDFDDAFEEYWWYDEDEPGDWRQRLWENAMICQGLDGLAMIRPGLQDAWVERIAGWREKVAAMTEAPRPIKVGRQATYDYPFLQGDLRVCVSGYVGGS